MPLAIAKDNLFPPLFSKLNKKGVPALGIITGSIVVSVMMIMNYTKGLAEQFKFLILLSTLTILVPYLFSTISFVIIRLEKKYSKQIWAQSIALASIAFLFSLWMVAGSGQEIVYWGFIAIIAGIPFYVWMLWKNKP